VDLPLICQGNDPFNQMGLQMAPDARPGLNPTRLARLMSDAIRSCRLDLRAHTVLTEAATGAYVVTPVLAAMAGAKVYALAASTGYATANTLERITSDLARAAGVSERIQFIREKNSSVIADADIITNSGQVRPIDAQMVSEMKETAVVSLMYESWEYRGGDVDLRACRARRIAVGGTNERHPAVDVFSFLGPLAVRQLHDAGVAAYRARVVVLCDNLFEPFITEGLRAGGADAVVGQELTETLLSPRCDAVIVARHPRNGPVLTRADAQLLATAAPGTVVVEYWGDTDRAALAALNVPVWPPQPSKRGHMAILPSALGPEPIIRLQAGGLKAGEVLARGVDGASPAELEFVQIIDLEEIACKQSY
jgi:hypothetical protein